jgi:pimeloyl-ACP methyl ester carboxylesterase
MMAAAERLNLDQSLIRGAPFTHRVYSNSAAASTTAKTLHIYVDGDGNPWIGPGRPAADPTPRNPLVLRLMAGDPSPAVYLGRPCHAETMDQGSCGVWDWTHGRYAEKIVASMAEATRRIIANRTFDRLVLIGFSGGGTLAMLMAERIPGLTDVVTLAGNLDVEAWTRQHGYSALTGSLDPAKLRPLRRGIRQWHWIGADDRRVPPELLLGAVQSGPHVRVTVLPGMDHTCCWEETWPRLLREITPNGMQQLPD